MPPRSPLHTATAHSDRWARGLQAWLAGWWALIHFGAQILVLALSPSSHRRGQRSLVAHTLYRATRPLLPSFTVLSALVATVIIRIVLATALSYGLSRYALDVLVRTLVLELIPLSAAMFVAVRYTLAAGDHVREMRARGEFERQLAAGFDPTRDEVLPRALAGMFAVVALAAVSGAVTLLLTYLSLYGFSTWGLAGFTRTVGQVFGPVIALIFTLKTLFFSLAVSIIPMVDAAGRRHDRAARERDDLQRLARLLAVILLVEVASLVGNYY
ncbi:MAG TPA: ABC transporter permease [Ideonella sp.]|nr:ABC transporter permease [Ideonella sp.]